MGVISNSFGINALVRAANSTDLNNINNCQPASQFLRVQADENIEWMQFFGFPSSCHKIPVPDGLQINQYKSRLI